MRYESRGCLGEPARHAKGTVWKGLGVCSPLWELLTGTPRVLRTAEVYFSFDFAINSFGLVLFIIIELPAFEDLGRSVCIDMIFIITSTFKD